MWVVPFLLNRLNTFACCTMITSKEEIVKRMGQEAADKWPLLAVN